MDGGEGTRWAESRGYRGWWLVAPLKRLQSPQSDELRQIKMHQGNCAAGGVVQEWWESDG